MTSSFYSELKSTRDRERADMESRSPVPKNTKGMLPLVLENWPKDDLYGKGVRAFTRIAMTSILNGCEALGWEEFINLLYEQQAPAVRNKCRNVMAKFDLPGNSALDVNILTWAWAMGCGFTHHWLNEYTSERTEGIGDWCPQVEALAEMGYPRESELGVWCDAYDNLILDAMNPDAWYVHTHCLQRGDKYCRVVIDLDAGKANKQDNYYKKLTGYKDIKTQELEARGMPAEAQLMYSPRVIDNLSAEERLWDGIKTKGAITYETLIVLANALGWEKFLNQADEKQSWGFNQCALALKRDAGITGSTLRDAAALAHVGYSSMGFDHQVIEYMPDRVEAVAQSCPILEAAKNMGMDDKIQDMSLWCDFYHNHNVHAVNADAQLTHTHCLARGDAYCRVVVK
jgi:hypothetical protein